MSDALSLQKIAKVDYEAYCMLVHRDKWKRSRHLKKVCDALQAIERGDLKRLMVFMPPRHGKSRTVSETFPSWFIGRSPERRVIVASYAISLARKFGRLNRAKVTDYGSELFGLSIQQDSKIQSDWNILDHDGGMVSAGIEGGITGQGADCVKEGTEIYTDCGSVKIESLNVGDEVLTYNHRERKIENKKIEAIRIRKESWIYRLTTARGRILEVTGNHKIFTRSGYVAADTIAAGDSILCVVREEKNNQVIRILKKQKKRFKGFLLQRRVFAKTSCSQKPKAMPDMQSINQAKRSLSRRKGVCKLQRETERKNCNLCNQKNKLSNMRKNVSAKVEGKGAREVSKILFKKMFRNRALKINVWEKQPKVEKRSNATSGATALGKGFQGNAPESYRKRFFSLRCLWCFGKATRSPYRQLANEQSGVKSCNAVRIMSHEMACGDRFKSTQDFVALVDRIREKATVYDIQVEGNKNFFAAGILVHNCLIIDDPIKNRQDAESETIREKVWDEWESTLKTRLHPGASVIVILTRWHHDDLAGRLLNPEFGPVDDWHIISMPLLADAPDDALGREIGAPLWPEHGYDKAWAERIKETTSARVFASIYQQRPTPTVGSIFQSDWWQYYRRPPDRDDMLIIQSWDTGYKVDDIKRRKAKHSFSVCLTWGQHATGYYLLDRFSKQMEYPDLKRSIRSEYEKHRPHAVLIEDKASGQSLVQDLRRETSLPIIAVPVSDGDKEQRAILCSPCMEAKRVWLPNVAPWLNEYKGNMESFPGGTNDDDVDATSQALKYLQEKKGRIITGGVVVSAATANR